MNLSRKIFVGAFLLRQKGVNMDYLTVKEVAELKGCSERYVQQLIKKNKLGYVSQSNPYNNHYLYMIPVSALSEDLQAKYYRRKQTEAGILPEKIETAKEKKTSLKYGSKGVKMPFENFSQKEREEIQKWISLLEEWQGERSRRKNKADFDELFIAHQKYMNPDMNISRSILYRKYSAYKSECYEELIDNRNKWRKGTSKLPDDSPIWQCFSYLYFNDSNPKVSQCYRSASAVIAEEYPELVPEIPNEACFRRKLEKIPFAVLEFSRNGAKAFHDHCMPCAVRLPDNLHANSVWVMDNYTFDVIVKDEENPEKTKRMYLTTVLDVKSGVLVGWNITDSPDSQSTLLALRFAILRFGVPEYLYFDNGREFVTYDIVGELTNRHISEKKKGNTPITILQHLGIKVIIAIPTNAQAKLVERIHRTIKEQFCRSERGFCGGNVLERAESLKRRIKEGDIEAQSDLFRNFSDYADNIFNVAEYGGSEQKYRGMTKIDVWNKSISETTQRTASEGVLDLLLMRTKGYQKIEKRGVYVDYHGEKVWYYDENITWKHIGEEVCVRYDPNSKNSVRLYDRDDRYMYTWNVADWMFTEYVGESPEKLAEISRKKSHVRNEMLRLRQEIIGDSLNISQQDGLDYIARQNKGKFEIRMSDNAVPITVSEELPKAVNDDSYTNIPVNIKMITKNAESQKGK
jgi:hypothetical protein